ncbi:N-acetyltransferase [Streptomyces goshikiensis]|uniref:N-acetyltransferase n=1 Tax=Streptomyces goshikiensis TaxID=1942 RepID=A0ABZ1RTL9_9ACTN|nr:MULTISPECIES: GNAT family N-acetyltransferase [Streptomyces]AKL64778.1 acetyltransferase [Streptomyces sp. Mg1]OKI44277.1 acetyltransferase [Streptomyces sp. CB03578]PJN18786.1 N-acetyltransferase [Streptomyces sp. CB02120-2]RPK41348.1 hypothetical protein EES37_20085 [Streptomyces sp. ADI91-18]WBY18669.1 GNAT family N-acetyltransferase [Streptomyces goshikiensis]
MADLVLRDDRERGVLGAFEDGTYLGGIAYFVLEAAPHALVAVHTVVEEGNEGRGIAGSLAREFYAMALREGVPVVPLCPYVAKWAQRHPEEAPQPEAEVTRTAEWELAARPDRW